MRYRSSDIDDVQLVEEFLAATAELTAGQAAKLARLELRRLMMWRNGARNRLHRRTRENLLEALAKLRRRIPLGRVTAGGANA